MSDCEKYSCKARLEGRDEISLSTGMSDHRICVYCEKWGDAHGLIDHAETCPIPRAERAEAAHDLLQTMLGQVEANEHALAAKNAALVEALEKIASVNTRAGWPRRIAMEALGRYADAPGVNNDE